MEVNKKTADFLTKMEEEILSPKSYSIKVSGNCIEISSDFITYIAYHSDVDTKTIKPTVSDLGEDKPLDRRYVLDESNRSYLMYSIVRRVKSYEKFGDIEYEKITVDKETFDNFEAHIIMLAKKAKEMANNEIPNP